MVASVKRLSHLNSMPDLIAPKVVGWTLEMRRSSQSVYVYASRGNGSITLCVYRLITRSARLKEQPNMNCQCCKQLTSGIIANYFLSTFAVAVWGLSEIVGVMNYFKHLPV